MTNSTSTSTKRITKRDHFNTLLAIPAVANDPALVEFIEHELDLLDRKNVTKDGEKKLTARQTENKALESTVAESMEPNHFYTVSDLLKSVDGLPADMTNQRLSRIVNNMVDGGVLKKTVDKRKSYFSLA